MIYILYAMIVTNIFSNYPKKNISINDFQNSEIVNKRNNVSSFNGCGLIQVTVILDNNCNGILDEGDEYSNSTSVTLMLNSSPVGTVITDNEGHGFYSFLEAGNYTSTISLPTDWTIGSSISEVTIESNGVGLITYFLCQTCNCVNTTGPPEQSLTIPNTVFPGIGLSFRITDPDYTPWQLGAYNANEYLLVIFNRWNGEVYRSTHKDCKGLKNGEITWNGLDNNGNPLQQGNYNGYLVLQNCDYYCKNDDWSSNFLNGLLDHCPKNVRYFNIILVR